MMLVYGNLFF